MLFYMFLCVLVSSPHLHIFFIFYDTNQIMNNFEFPIICLHVVINNQIKTNKLKPRARTHPLSGLKAYDTHPSFEFNLRTQFEFTYQNHNVFKKLFILEPQ